MPLLEPARQLLPLQPLTLPPFPPRLTPSPFVTTSQHPLLRFLPISPLSVFASSLSSCFSRSPSLSSLFLPLHTRAYFCLSLLSLFFASFPSPYGSLMHPLLHIASPSTTITIILAYTLIPLLSPISLLPLHPPISLPSPLPLHLFLSPYIPLTSLPCPPPPPPGMEGPEVKKNLMVK